MGKKKIIFITIVAVLVIAIAGLVINILSKNSKLKENEAIDITNNFFETMFPVFNTTDREQIANFYLPCQDSETIELCDRQIYLDFYRFRPLVYEGALDFETLKRNDIKGRIVYNDNDGSYNIIEEYENGWQGFGNKKVAEFELVKKKDKYYLKSFKVTANYNWSTIQKDNEFMKLYVENILNRKEIEKYIEQKY